MFVLKSKYEEARKEIEKLKKDIEGLRYKVPNAFKIRKEIHKSYELTISEREQLIKELKIELEIYKNAVANASLVIKNNQNEKQ